MPQTPIKAAIVGGCAAAALAAHGAAAYEFPRATPAEAGLDAVAMEALKARMHALVDDGRRAGIVYGVVYKGRLVALDAYGKRDIARDLPMTEDTIFRIFSMSRAVTAAAALTLQEDGKLRQEDPVSKFVPEFAKTPVIRGIEGGVVATEPQSTPLTVHHLFTYTAGLGYSFDWPKSYGMQMSDVLQANGSTEAGIAALAAYPLLTQPGKQWQYGFSSDVLGRIAEVASGEPLDQFLKTRLFDRIGMKDTAFWYPDNQDRIARTYGPAPDGGLKDVTATTMEAEYGSFKKPIGFKSAGGGLASTVTDYLRFCQMLLNGGELGGARVLQPQTVQAMITRQTTPEQKLAMWYNPGPHLYAWGLAIGVAAEEGDSPMPHGAREAGWAGMMNTFYFIDPDRDLAAVAMSQHYGGDDEQALNVALHEGVYAALKPPVTSTK